MSTSETSGAVIWDLESPNYCVELEFMVAKERKGHDYTSRSQQTRWACPAGASGPGEVLYKCRKIIESVKRSPVVREEERELADASRYGAEPQSWLLQPSGHVVPRDGCPSEYEWVGVRLRSPVMAESDMVDDESLVRKCIRALRAAVRIHVNSTCQFNVFVQPTGGYVGPTQAKRLVTLAWLLETAMLLPLCATAEGQTSGPATSLTEHSAILSFPLKGPDSTRSEDLLLTAIMDQNLPRLHDDATRERMQRLWSYTEVSQVAEAISDTDGRPLAFSLDIYRAQNADSGKPLLLSMAGFRYAIWHPYKGMDASEYWVDLAVAMFRASQLDSKRFRKLAQAIDGTNLRLSEDGEGEDEEAQRQALMSELGLSDCWYEPLGEIVSEYRPGGKLSAEVIDKQPSLV